MEERPWGSHDPNSSNQRWSRWTFRIDDQAPADDAGRNLLLDNFRRWCRGGFKTAGRVMFEEATELGISTYYLTCEVEGPDVTDPGYVRAVELNFAQSFLTPGFGSGTPFTMTASLLAGDGGDGRPRRQLLVMPTITSQRENT